MVMVDLAEEVVIGVKVEHWVVVFLCLHFLEILEHLKSILQIQFDSASPLLMFLQLVSSTRYLNGDYVFRIRTDTYSCMNVGRVLLFGWDFELISSNCCTFVVSH